MTKLIKHFLVNLIFIIPTVTLGQEIVNFNNNFIAVPIQSDFQSIELINRTGTMEMWLGFDDGATGSLYQYLLRNENEFAYLEFKNLIILPSELNHPNDLHISNDSLFVTGWNNTNEAIIGLYHLNSFRCFYSTILEDNWHLQFSFVCNSQLYLGVVNNTDVILQPFDSHNSFHPIKLVPSPMISATNYINGALVIGNWLILLTAFPNCLHFYDCNNFSFLFSIDLQNENFESEGIAGYKNKNDNDNEIVLFIGFRPPNHIAKFTIKVGTADVFTNLIGSKSQVQLTAYPNPFSESINVQILSSHLQTISLDVINLLGYRVRPSMIFHLKMGINYLHFNLSSLVPGTYFFHISNGRIINETYKVIKL